MVELALVATICSVAFFLAGTAVGYKLAEGQWKRSNRVWPNELPKLLVPADFCHDLDSELLTRIQALAVLAVHHRAVMPILLWQAIEELAQVTKKIRQQTETVSQTTVHSVPNSSLNSRCLTDKTSDAITSSNSPRVATSQAKISDGGTPALTGCEFQRLTENEPEGIDCEKKLSKTRRKFKANQVVYCCYETEDGYTLAPATTVRCNDLGVEGISFFWPKSPNFERLVIALGTEARPVYLLAEVKNSKAVVMNNEACYLVGCRFLRRFDRFSDIVQPANTEGQPFREWTNPSPALGAFTAGACN